jgi:hypothetical protein
MPSVYRSLILADNCRASRVSEMGCAEALSAGAVGWSLPHTDDWSTNMALRPGFVLTAIVVMPQPDSAFKFPYCLDWADHDLTSSSLRFG